MKKLFLIIIVFILSQRLINAQEDTLRWSVGLFFDYNYLIHSADFKKLPDCPSCSPGYEEGNGLAPALGLLFEYPLNQSFVIGIRANYFDYGGQLTKVEGTTVILDGVQQTGEFEHSITASLSSIGLEPHIKYEIAGGLILSAGFQIGTVLKSTYEQYEKIVKPSDRGTFLDGTRIRNELSGDIVNSNSLNMTLLTGLSYELPLNHSKTLILEPELKFNYGLLPIVDDTEVKRWDYMSFGAGIAIKYSPFSEKEIEKYEEIQKIDTLHIISENIKNTTFLQGKVNIKTDVKRAGNTLITTKSIMRTDTIFEPKKEILECSIYAVGVDTLGKEFTNPIFTIEEFTSNRVQPLLPYIFFDDNSSEIPIKYNLLAKNNKTKFSMSNLYNHSTLETYYEILNIIGFRMTQYPEAKLTITGCNSDFGNEESNEVLSTQRADIVKDYLTKVWNIESKRLTTNSRNLPESASLPKNQDDKMAENRRVEFSSNTYEITEPIFLYDTLRIASPPIARFYPKVKSTAGVSLSNINAQRVGGLGIINFDTTKQGEPTQSVDWILEKDQRKIPKGNEDLEYQFTVTDNKLNICKTEQQVLPIEYVSIEYKRKEIRNDKEYHKFALILFDFDDYKISGNNQKILNHIKKVITPESEVTISGYSDRTGEDEHNIELSLKRANNLQQMLNHPNCKVLGIGEKELLYANDIPEGRFYCRTVEVRVETSIVK